MVSFAFSLSKLGGGEWKTPRDGRRQGGARRRALDAALRVVTDGTGAAAVRPRILRQDVHGECLRKAATEGYKKEVYNIGFCGFIDNSSSNLVCFVGANEVYAMRQTTQIFNDIMENAVKQYNITSMPSN